MQATLQIIQDLRKKLYRYVDVATWDRPGVKIELLEYPIIKYTPKGFWIGYPDTWPSDNEKFKWVSATGNFAHDTKEKAMKSFIIRKKGQIKIVKAQLAFAEKALAMIDQETKTIKDPKKLFDPIFARP